MVSHVVLADDPREGLRGKACLVASRDLEVDHVVGTYCGFVQGELDHDMFMKKKPHFDNPSQEQFDKWEAHVESFTFCDPEGEAYSIENNNGEKIDLYNCSIGYGNLCSLANDPKLLESFWNREGCNRLRTDEGLYKEAEVVFEPNCNIFPVLIRGFPHLFLVTTKCISAGSELLYEYGSGYWKLQRKLDGDLSEKSSPHTEIDDDQPNAEFDAPMAIVDIEEGNLLMDQPSGTFKNKREKICWNPAPLAPSSSDSIFPRLEKLENMEWIRPRNVHRNKGAQTRTDFKRRN